MIVSQSCVESSAAEAGTARVLYRFAHPMFHLDKAVIDECAASIPTLGFDSGIDTNRRYTKAKIVDMVGFMEGYK